METPYLRGRGRQRILEQGKRETNYPHRTLNENRNRRAAPLPCRPASRSCTRQGQSQHSHNVCPKNTLPHGTQRESPPYHSPILWKKEIGGDFVTVFARKKLVCLAPSRPTRRGSPVLFGQSAVLRLTYRCHHMTDERAWETKSRCQQSCSQRHCERERLSAGAVKRAAIFGFVLRNEGAWESNPPARLVTPPTGFEDRAGHRARSTLTPSISDRHPDRQV